MTIFAAVTSWSGIQWSSLANMCSTGNTSRSSWGALWGAPMFFEVIILSSVIYNTLASPRSAQVPLRKALQNGGIAFFVIILTLRLVNLVLAVVAPKSLKLVVIFLIWASDMTVLNRFIIRQLRTESVQVCYHVELPTSNFRPRPELEMTSWMPSWTP